jgi:ABC-2 type transport system permease protein
MRIIRLLLEKEFKQIFRNPAILVMIIAMPLIQLLVLPLAANYEVKNIKIAVVDLDHSADGRRLISKIGASRHFTLQQYGFSYQAAMQAMDRQEVDLILEIPAKFEKDLVRQNHADLFVSVNAINGMKAGLSEFYLRSIIKDFNEEVNLELVDQQADGFSPAPNPRIATSVITWFNPHQLYHLFMVPGILAFLVTMITGFLSALNIVKEKETGTIEQMNVSPIKKHHFILGKLIPFWIIGNVVFALGLVVAALVYGIIPVGSILLLFFFLWIYLLAILGFGLLVSNYCSSQQQAMLVMFYFMMIFILMGGLLTSIEGMPAWAKVIAALNPVTYMIEVVRMVVLKGSGLADVWPQLAKIMVFAVVLNAWAIWSYKKVRS